MVNVISRNTKGMNDRIRSDMVTEVALETLLSLLSCNKLSEMQSTSEIQILQPNTACRHAIQYKKCRTT